MAPTAPDHSEKLPAPGPFITYSTVGVDGPGLPSQLLRRRPDLAQAERALAGASARYGVAVADLYPSFSLLGGFGFASTQASGLFNAASQAWSIRKPISPGNRAIAAFASASAS